MTYIELTTLIKGDKLPISNSVLQPFHIYLILDWYLLLLSIFLTSLQRTSCCVLSIFFNIIFITLLGHSYLNKLIVLLLIDSNYIEQCFLFTLLIFCFALKLSLCPYMVWHMFEKIVFFVNFVFFSYISFKVVFYHLWAP